MLAMAEQYFEMLWDCAQCDASGLLGTTHRHCPTCGAAQDPDRRYFPAPGQEVEAKGHRFVGADWACAYCESPNSAAAAFCGNCGGPRDGARQVNQVSDAAPGAAARPAVLQPAQAPAPKPGFRWLKALLAMLLLGVGLAYLFFSQHDERVQIVEKTWSRQIDVERYTSVRGADWCDALPPQAYQVSRSREQRGTRQVEAGQDCVELRSDVGDGSFTKRRECSTRYRDEPVFDDKCSYRINRWQVTRTDQLTGGASLAPTWPAPVLGRNLAGGNSLGAERLGMRRENYQVKLQSAQGKNWTCDLPPEVWSRLAEHQPLTIKVRGTGGAACASLATPP